MSITHTSRRSLASRTKQKGVVLLITLIMLVAMTLAAISLMRSVDTTNIVAGNLAFQQSAYQGADIGTEQAIAFLNTTLSGTAVAFPDGSTAVFAVNCNGTGPGVACPVGYKSWNQPTLEPPAAGVTWDSYWSSMQTSPGVVALTGLPSGYSGAFVVESLCTSAAQTGCTTVTISSTTTTPQGQDMGSQQRSFVNNTSTVNAHYYRVTTRVDGPRNSVAYVQTTVVW
jgi:Tfp pilus assembly protein PilX